MCIVYRFNYYFSGSKTQLAIITKSFPSIADANRYYSKNIEKDENGTRTAPARKRYSTCRI